MKEYNLVHIAQTLMLTMTNAGYMDDLDEIVADMIDNKSIDKLYEWAIGVNESIQFINDQLGTSLKIDAMAEISKQIEE